MESRVSGDIFLTANNLNGTVDSGFADIESSTLFVELFEVDASHGNWGKNFITFFYKITELL